MSTLPRKRILKELVIDKIAAVDSPCNAHARVVIMKRADPMETDMQDLDQLEVDVMRLEKQLAKMDKATPPPRKSQRGKHANLEDISDEAEADGDENADESDDDEDASVNKRHRFVALAENLANEENVPKAEALTRARLKYPDLYASYQNYNDVSKFADLLQDELRKGCSPNVAAHRVAMLHPHAARASIAKRAADGAEFMQAVESYRSERGCSHALAMVEMRKRNPDAFNRFQNG